MQRDGGECDRRFAWMQIRSGADVKAGASHRFCKRWRQGLVINRYSILGLLGMRGMSRYTASKGAVLQMVCHLLAPFLFAVHPLHPPSIEDIVPAWSFLDPRHRP